MKHAAERTPHTQTGSLSPEDITRQEKGARVVGGIALITMALTLGSNLITQNREPAEQPNPAASAEQGAVALVDAVYENPDLLNSAKVTPVTVLEGDSVSSVAQRAAREHAEQADWDAEQKNLNQGVINKTSDEVLGNSRKSRGYSVSVQPGDTVLIIKEDTNGDGTGEFFPVGLDKDFAKRTEQ